MASCYMNILFKIFILDALMMVTVVYNETTLQSFENTLTAKQWLLNKATKHHWESPTNIETANAVSVPLVPLTVHNIFNVANSEVVIENTGYYLEVKLPEGVKHKPFINGGPLDNTYIFEQLHFHWGHDNNYGSEHKVNGHPYPTEVHMVWYNEKYGSYNKAVNYADGVAVISFFGKLRRTDNKDFEELIEKLNKIKLPNTTTTGSFKEEFAFLKVLFKQKSYYSFPGSLTTPPFQNCVIWIMFIDQPFPISPSQLAAFRSLKNKKGKMMTRGNDRSLRKFGGRPLINSKLNN